MKKHYSVLGLLVGFCVLCMVISTTGCSSQADKVNYNLTQEADALNVTRELLVFNDITGDVKMQIIGRMSIKADVSDNQLEIIVEDSPGHYKKEFVGLNVHTSYLARRVDVTDVDRYKYTINFNPKMWIPVGIDAID